MGITPSGMLRHDRDAAGGTAIGLPRTAWAAGDEAMADERARTIMLVEDEAIIALAESRTISGFGYEVVVARSGEEAVDRAAADGAVDLVLMDIDLGKGIDGPEAARRILARRDVPIVFLTAHSEKSFVERVREITRYGYVVKQSSDFVLQSSIDTALRLFGANECLRRERDELRRSREALEDSEERCREIITKMADYVYTVRYRGGKPERTVHNPACAAITGYSAGDFEANPYLWFEMIAPEDRRRVEDYARGIEAGRAGMPVEHRILRKDGATRWIRNTAVPHYDAKGELRSVDGIIVDITDRMAAEERAGALLEEKNALLKELMHRIKNSMANLAGMLALQAESSGSREVREALAYAQSRVRCIGALYDKLNYRDKRPFVLAREYFGEIIPGIFGALCAPCEISIKADIADVLLPADYFLPIGIITNELITNSVKHAFVERSTGRIDVRFQAPSENECILSVTDDGVGIRPMGKGKGKKRVGFGTALVDLLSRQLGGSVELGGGSGTSCEVKFPVERCVRAGTAIA
jgi:PAS domain S-box-containing protein